MGCPDWHKGLRVVLTFNTSVKQGFSEKCPDLHRDQTGFQGCPDLHKGFTSCSDLHQYQTGFF